MSKSLRKAIMNQSKLRNKFLKTRIGESKTRFNFPKISVLELAPQS